MLYIYTYLRFRRMEIWRSVLAALDFARLCYVGNTVSAWQARFLEFANQMATKHPDILLIILA